MFHKVAVPHPDGGFVTVVSELPGGGFAPTVHDPSTECSPCQCDDDPGGPDGCDHCGPLCDGPGCQIVLGARGIPCLDVVFNGYQVLEGWIPREGTSFEDRWDVYAFPTMVRVQNLFPSNSSWGGFEAEVPMLARFRRRSSFSGNIITDEFYTGLRVSVTLDHCRNAPPSQDPDFCPMTTDIELTTFPVSNGFPVQSYRSRTPTYLGVEIINEADPFGNPDDAPPNENYVPFRLGNAVAGIPDDCDPLPATYYWRECGTADQITVDLNTLPGTLNGGNVRFNNDLHVATGEPSTDPPVAVTWTDTDCVEWPLLGLCDGGSFRLPYDPDLRPAGATTALFAGLRLKPVPEATTSPPIPVEWTFDPCPNDGGDGGGNVPGNVSGGPTDAQDAGGPIDASIEQNAMTRLAQQQMARYLGQYPGRCPGCGG